MARKERSETEVNLSGLKRSFTTLDKEAPDLQRAFVNYLNTLLTDTALDVRTKELIIIGIAVSKGCRPCLELHISKGLEAGCTREEIIEAGYCGVCMGGGPAFTYMQYVLKALDELAE